MNKILFLVLATVFSLSSNFRNNQDTINKAKQQISKKNDGFYFIIDSGGNDSYNSKTEKFKRCSRRDPFSKTYPIRLTLNEKRRIENLFNKVDFINMPDEFKIDPYSIERSIMISPSFISSIIMHKGNAYKKVMLDMIDLSNPILFKEKAYKYKELNDSIWNIIRVKEEYKKIPKSDCVYL